jgi:segregation and condensation protein B
MTAPDSDDHSPPAFPEPSEAGRHTASEAQDSAEPDRSAPRPPPIRSSVTEPAAIDPDPAELEGPDSDDLQVEPSAGERAGTDPDGSELNGTTPARSDRGRPEGATANGARAGAGTAAGHAARTALEDEPDEDDVLAGLGGPPLGGVDAWPTDEVLEAVDLDDTGWTRRNLEAILLVADQPVPATTLAELVGARLTQVESLLIDLAGEYAGQGRGFVLRAVAGGWRLYTHPAARDVVEAYLRAGQQSRLTRAALETLAVVAYRQPVTRHQVAAVRGVNVDGVFRTLATRGLIHEIGHEEGPGQAALYGTTPAFLEQLGLNGLDQLPPIKDYLPEGVDFMELLEQM